MDNVFLRFLTKTLCTPLLTATYATCLTHLILLDLITQIIFGEQYRSERRKNYIKTRDNDRLKFQTVRFTNVESIVYVPLAIKLPTCAFCVFRTDLKIYTGNTSAYWSEERHLGTWAALRHLSHVEQTNSWRRQPAKVLPWDAHLTWSVESHNGRLSRCTK
jgi:hypothetical protein